MLLLNKSLLFYSKKKKERERKRERERDDSHGHVERERREGRKAARQALSEKKEVPKAEGLYWQRVSVRTPGWTFYTAGYSIWLWYPTQMLEKLTFCIMFPPFFFLCLFLLLFSLPLSQHMYTQTEPHTQKVYAPNSDYFHRKLWILKQCA